MMFFRCCCGTKAFCCVFKVQFSLHSHSTLSYLILNRSFKILYLNWSWHKCIWTVQAYLQLDVILTIIVFMIWRIVIFYCQWLSMKYMWQQENCGMLEQKLMSIFLSMEKKVTQDQDSCSDPRNPRNFWKDKWVKEYDKFGWLFSLRWVVMQIQLGDMATTSQCFFKIPQLSQNYSLKVYQCFWKIIRIFIYKIGKLCTLILNI